MNIDLNTNDIQLTCNAILAAIYTNNKAAALINNLEAIKALNEENKKLQGLHYRLISLLTDED